MDFKKMYQAKLVTAEQAASVVKSGDWVDYGWCTGTTVKVDEALAKRLPELTDVKFRGAILFHVPEIFKIEDPAAHFTWNSWHMSGIERKAIAKGFCYYAPVRYSEIARYYSESKDPLNVAVFQAAPMDEHGWFNVGTNASHIESVVEKADKVIVEVNENFPVCFGSSLVHIRDVDMVVEGDNPPVDSMGEAAPPTDIDIAVASYVVPEIPNGACLQLGIGGMPNAIGKEIAKSDLKDLGVHTEMYVDAFVELTEAGKISGKYKPLQRGKQVYAFGAGTKKLYDFLNNNPECLNLPVGYVNDYRTIAQLDNFISINNAVDIDLFGQISAETSGIRHISGAGGQLDFVLGAYAAKGGKSFMCLSSTFTDKATGRPASRIRPTLSPGTIVTDTRANTMNIVTEYGMVNLKGLTVWQRAESLIGIANPIFRDELIAEAEKMNIWRRSNRR
ncbi:MAG: butyryl-CoA:acetate CoA-transferase [Eubacterium sp.]|nr:butyryl-CoA:acetate CoA-transferase [Eubacterium sp.]